MGEIREFHQEKVYAPGAGAMNAAEVDEFLASPDSAWLLKLATLKEDGWPIVIPVWYAWKDQSFWVVGRKHNEWVKDLVRDPRAAVCIEEREHPRIRKVLAQCVAEVVDGPRVAEGSLWLPVAEEMATRYIGPTGPEQLAPSHAWERYLVKLTPRDGKLTTWQGADWARRYFEPGQRPDLELRGASSKSGSPL